MPPLLDVGDYKKKLLHQFHLWPLASPLQLIIVYQYKHSSRCLSLYYSQDLTTTPDSKLNILSNDVYWLFLPAQHQTSPLRHWGGPGPPLDSPGTAGAGLFNRAQCSRILSCTTLVLSIIVIIMVTITLVLGAKPTYQFIWLSLFWPQNWPYMSHQFPDQIILNSYHFMLPQ